MTNATQIIILGVFIFFLVVAVIVFAMFGGSNNSASEATAVIWGPLPESVMARATEILNNAKAGSIKIKYQQIPAEEFEERLTNALADGTGPDAVLMTEDLLYTNRKRLTLISYNAFSERAFKDTFVSASEVLLTDEGAYGLPFLVDPIVMYWNRDILSSAAVAEPPKTWEQSLALVPLITEVNDDKTIKRSAIGLGDFANVNHSKAILSALMMQAGSRMIFWGVADAAVNQIDASQSFDTNPAEEALQFFTQFANPGKKVYSWTRALPQSMDYFAQGDLALYFGPASDGQKIRSKNPNLNFDVAMLPQPATSQTKRTSSSVLSFSILTSSPNQQGALNAIALLTGSVAGKLASDMTGLAPARRDLLSQTGVGASQSVALESALIASSWLDPDARKTTTLFGRAAESIISGQAGVVDAAKTLSNQIDEILQNQ